MTQIVPSLDSLKREARRLRLTRSPNHQGLSHGAALEAVAHAHGFRNWNTLRAMAVRQAARLPFRPGERVQGAYLGQAFTGVVLEASPTADGLCRLALNLDTPVDVVRFDSFSALRHRISGRVDAGGVSPECTSDGVPHLRIRSS